MLYQQLLSEHPDNINALHNLGVLYCELREYQAAIALFNQVVKFQPHDVQAWFHLARALEEAQETDLAQRTYLHLTTLDSRYVRAYERLGMIYETRQQTAEALTAYRTCYQLNPSPAAAEKYFRQLQHACLWQEIDELLATLRHQKHIIHMPLCHVTSCNEPEKNLLLNQQLSQRIKAHAQRYNLRFSHANRRKQKDVITIGYLSGDFHDNATAHLMRGLFGLHDRSHFRIHAYSFGVDDKSAYRHDIAAHCDAFIDIRALDDAEAAQRMYRDAVDILVDLKGYTAGHRIGICALRPAPIQVTWLGYPGTTGADFMDYIITDRIVIPDDHASYYAEQRIYLPHCYQVNDHLQPIADRAFDRTECGLPQTGFIFCSFNQPYKIEPMMFEYWMRILHAVQGSVLWLFSNNALAEANLKKEAAIRSIAPERIVFATRIPKPEHLARIQLAGLALDTRICGGHTTTSDALWAGVPVVTLLGRHFASRVSASLLSAIGLPELITHSLEEYEQHAITLATQPEKLAEFKSRLQKNRHTCPLFDTPHFVKYLEMAYHAIWNRWIENQNPATIEIAS